jgi:putative ABC transport system permease protein
MWQNRFGDQTVIRLRGGDKNQVEAFLKKNIDPAQLGFFSQAVKEEGISASTQSVDFSQLFLGLSFFIIMAGLLLTALLFLFNVQQRAPENGLLLAVGYPRGQVTRLMLLEGLILIIIGVFVGGFAGIFYNQLIIWALKTVWIGIVQTPALDLYIHPPSVMLGQLAAVLLSFFTIWLASRKQLSQPIAPLQRGMGKLDIIGTVSPRKWPPAILLLIFIGVMVAALRNYQTGRDTFMIFLTAGFILLFSGTLMARYFLFRLNTNRREKPIHLFSLSSRNCARNPMRSLTIVGLLAIGLFLIFTIGTNYRSAEKDASKRESGTGGFTLYGESTLPVFFNLNTHRGREFYGLQHMAERGMGVVHFRIKDGDDASCLNLNRVSHPSLAGVDPEELSRRGAFRVKEKMAHVDAANPWESLKQKLDKGIIPAIADQTVIQWGLGKKIGDTLTYRDERGDPFRIKLVAGLANSIFQGKIILAEDLLMEKYPSIEGYRLFLVDTPVKETEAIQQELTWTLQDLGMDLMSASHRLAQFNKVENTYLSIFLVLGSLAMILGSFGIGVVILRNVNERRGELAVMQAVGFMRRSLKSMILRETIILVIIGALAGTAASLLSMLPTLLRPGTRPPMVIIGLLLLTVIGSILLWTHLATSLAMKRDLIPALREE